MNTNTNKNYTLNYLINKKIYELINICKEKGITGYWVNDNRGIPRFVKYAGG